MYSLKSTKSWTVVSSEHISNLLDKITEKKNPLQKKTGQYYQNALEVYKKIQIDKGSRVVSKLQLKRFTTNKMLNKFLSQNVIHQISNGKYRAFLLG